LETLEADVLQLLRYNVTVKCSLYSLYQFELQQLYVTKYDNFGRNWKPITEIEAEQNRLYRNHNGSSSVRANLREFESQQHSFRFKDDSIFLLRKNRAKLMLKDCA